MKTNDWKFEEGKWTRKVVHVSESGEAEDMRIEWEVIPIIKVPIDVLIKTWEDIVLELSEKEVELAKVKEEYLVKEFEILTTFDFKKIYGKDNEKIRKAHVHNELFDLGKRKESLELSINFIKSYIPLLKEVIRCKQ